MEALLQQAFSYLGKENRDYDEGPDCLVTYGGIQWKKKAYGFGTMVIPSFALYISVSQTCLVVISKLALTIRRVNMVSRLSETIARIL